MFTILTTLKYISCVYKFC